jgi:hypothetical protein
VSKISLLHKICFVLDCSITISIESAEMYRLQLYGFLYIYCQLCFNVRKQKKPSYWYRYDVYKGHKRYVNIMCNFPADINCTSLNDTAVYFGSV